MGTYGASCSEEEDACYVDDAMLSIHFDKGGRSCNAMQRTCTHEAPTGKATATKPIHSPCPL